MTRKILVLRAGALGDVILTFPALEILRSRYPDASIRVVGYPGFWEIARPLVDEIASIDSPIFAGLFADSPLAGGGSDPPRRPTLPWLDGVDLAIAWTARDVGPALRATGIPSVVSASPYPPPGVHAADWLRSALEALTPQASQSDEFSPTSLPLAREHERGNPASTATTNDGPIILHPGAGAGWKRWPAERFARLADQLALSGHPVLLVEGPADAAAVGEVRQRASAPLEVLRGLSVRQLAAALAQGRLFIGNDSGVTHLAAAAGVPTVALFGPTDPASWAPPGARVVRSCSARTRHQGQVRVCDDPDCMRGISVEDVLAEVNSLC